jgi:phytoene synthase
LSVLDPDRLLALAYVGRPRRSVLNALWTLDAALGAAVAGASESMLAAIKLSWWHERLDELESKGAPAEPVLQAVAREVIPAGVAGRALAELTEGWRALLVEGRLQPGDMDHYAALRGGALFRLSASLLEHAGESMVEAAGEAWALADLARRTSQSGEAETALSAAQRRFDDAFARKWPAPLRPLGMIAALARRDVGRGAGRIERQGSPGRMLAMIAHRLTGR